MNTLDIALKEYGIWEWPGAENNPRVLNYFKEIGQGWVKDDETAWCAAFVNWCLVKSGKPQTGSLAARSFLSYGVSTKNPQLGDIAVFWRGTKDGSEGHVAFYISETQNFVYVLGGNQLDQVNISKISKAKLLDYRQIPKV
jgi:uncharacterized protein (TIGR02594 family)